MRKYITDWIDSNGRELSYSVSKSFSWVCVGCWMAGSLDSQVLFVHLAWLLVGLFCCIDQWSEDMVDSNNFDSLSFWSALILN